MVQLVFDATQYPPDQDDAPQAITWDPYPKTQAEYIAACKARLQLMEAANKRWRAAIRALQAAKIEADELRDAWHEIKNTKPPRSPFAEIVLAGGELDPRLTDE